MERYQATAIQDDLQKKMVFIVGPRQAGKTWLAKNIAKQYANPLYLNYDEAGDREIIVSKSWLETADLLVLDELHKMPDWKNYLKGLYDTKPPHMKILVTGSAKLDVMTHIGDALAGRYFVHHLLPFSLSEARQVQKEILLDDLIARSGFPEPLLAESLTEANRWRMQYIQSMLIHDVFDFEQIKNVKNMQLLFQLLQYRVGSPVSYQSLAQDLQISQNTVKNYLAILESLYLVFRVTPYSKNIARSLLKEPKIYFFDSALVEGDDGLKFENQIAVSLLKSAYARRDYLAEDISLQYLRTKDQKEVDFAITNRDTIETIIEVKHQSDELSKNLFYFHQKYALNAVQVVKHLRHSKMVGKIKVIRGEDFLTEQYL